MQNNSNVRISSVVAAAVSFFVFLAVSLLYNSSVLTNADDTVYEFTAKFMSPTLTAFFKSLTMLGSAVSIVSLCLILLIIPLLRWNNGGRAHLKNGIYVSLVIICSQAFNSLLKYVFLRPRPDILPLVVEKSMSFPSGHAMSSMCLALTLTFIFRSDFKDKSKALVLGIFIIFIAVLIGLSRVYLGAHYFTDVAAGFAAGAFIAFSANIILLNCFPRR